MPEKDKYVNAPRLTEYHAGLLALINTLLSGYTTPDAVATAITTALTNYATNNGVQAAIAAALVNYMTSTEVNDAIAAAVAEAGHIIFQTVDVLPATGEPNVIYMVPSGGAESNIKDEYMWIGGKWEAMGTTQMELGGYWAKDELQAMTAEEIKAILAG